MVRITAIKNPIEPIRYKQYLEMPNGLTIDEYLDAIQPPIPTLFSLAVLYNHTLIDVLNPPPVPDDCELIFCAVPSFGGGDTAKMVTKLVAMAVITLVSVGVGGWLAGKTMLALAAGFATNAFVAGVAMVGSLAGSFLLNAILPTGAIASPIGDSSISESNTYSWDVGTNKSNEGLTLPVLYGEMRITPILISKAVIFEEEKTEQYLRLIYALTQWAIDTPESGYYNDYRWTTKPTAACRDITINDVEYDQYDDVYFNHAVGNNYQKALEKFEGTYSDHSYNTYLEDDVEKSFSTFNDIIDAAFLVFSFPNGLYAISGSGTTETKVAISISYKTPNGTWTDIQSQTEAGYEESDPKRLDSLHNGDDYWTAGYWADGMISGGLHDEHKFVMLKDETPGLTSNGPVWKFISPVGTIPTAGCGVEGVIGESKYYTYAEMQLATYEFKPYTDGDPAIYWTAGYFNGMKQQDEDGWWHAIWVQLDTDDFPSGHQPNDPYGSTTSGDGHTNGEVYNSGLTEFPGCEDKDVICHWYLVEDGIIDYSSYYTSQYVTFTYQGAQTTNYVVFSGNDTGSLIKYKKVTLSPQVIGEVEFKVTRVNPNDKYEEFTKLTEGRNKVYLYYISEYIDFTFLYPNVAIMGLRILASEQLSGSIPTVACTISRQIINIPKNGSISDPPKQNDYNYTSARNPAWVCYDILHGAQHLNQSVDSISEAYVYIAGGVDPSDIDYDMFLEWATFCDLEQTDYDSQNNPTRVKVKFTCDLYFDTTVNVRKALDTVGLLGRGAVTQSGTMFTCTIEKPEENPAQRFIFNMSNIEESSYSESWLPFDDRANVIEVKFWDKTNNYEADVVTIMTDQYEEDLNNFAEERKTSIDYVGCTDRAMASYFGKFLLNCNKYITLTATWTAFIDAIGCYPGQIIEVQNDLPQYGYGGRILEVYSSGGIRIDQTFNFELNETYELVIYSQSDLRSYYTFTVIDNELDDVLTTDTLKPDSFNFYDQYNSSTQLVLSSSLYLDAKYNFGRLQSSSKLMRVLSISHASDDKRKITAVEFLNDVYDGSLTINPFNPGDLPNEFRPPKLASATIIIEWMLNKDKRLFEPFIQISLNQDPDVDYYNTYKIDYYEISAHLVSGDVHDVIYSGNFEVVFNWQSLQFIYSAYGFDKYTIYTKARVHNTLKYWSYFSDITATYIDLSITANFKADLEIYHDMEGTDFGYVYESDRFMIAIKWQPAGSVLTERPSKTSVYLPVLDWNLGENYYKYSNYVIAYGFTELSNQYPDYKDLTIIETANIGDIYDVTGTLIDPNPEDDEQKITNQELLHSILTKSSMYGLYFKYQFKYIHIAVIAKTKYGGISYVDTSLPDLGLNWVHIYMPVPYAALSVLVTQVTDAKLIVKQMPNTVYLTEMRWSYPLKTPFIDGFALIYRLQTYWWCWLTKEIIIGSENGHTAESFNQILENDYIDFESLGGQAGQSSFTNQITTWIDENAAAFTAGTIYPHPYMYMSFTDNELYEILKVSLLPGHTGETYRNAEVLPKIWFEYVKTEALLGWPAVEINPTTYISGLGSAYGPNDTFFILLLGQSQWEPTEYTITAVSIDSTNRYLIYFSPQITEASWPPGSTLIIGDTANVNFVPTWNEGTVFSYLPCESNDSWTIINDTTLRSFLFGNTVEIKCAIHLTMIAFKFVEETQYDETPGYQRTNYIVWEVREDS